METPSNANNASNAAPFSHTRAYIIQNKNFTLNDHKQGMERSGWETLDSRMKVWFDIYNVHVRARTYNFSKKLVSKCQHNEYQYFTDQFYWSVVSVEWQ